MPAGRPPLFSSAIELQEKIEEYFDGQYGSVTEPDTETGLVKQTPGYNITITGLALYLGFETRQSFYDYEKHEEYSYIIKRARLHVEAAYESNLYGKNPTGSIFALKNMGWSDKQEIDQKTEHSGGITIHWEEPPVQHSSNQGSTGELPSLQGGLQDNS